MADHIIYIKNTAFEIPDLVQPGDTITFQLKDRTAQATVNVLGLFFTFSFTVMGDNTKVHFTVDAAATGQYKIQTDTSDTTNTITGTINVGSGPRDDGHGHGHGHR